MAAERMAAMSEGRKADNGLFRKIERYIKANYVRPEKDYTAMLSAAAGIACGVPRGFSATPSFRSKKPLRSLLDTLLQMTEKTFAEKLMLLIKKSGARAADIYSKAGITKQHFSKIKNQASYQPSKETALAFAIVLHLSLAEAEDLIGRAGFKLSESSKRDLIVKFFIEEKIYDVDAVNEQLYVRGFPPLTNRRQSKE